MDPPTVDGDGRAHRCCALMGARVASEREERSNNNNGNLGIVDMCSTSCTPRVSTPASRHHHHDRRCAIPAAEIHLVIALEILPLPSRAGPSAKAAPCCSNICVLWGAHKSFFTPPHLSCYNSCAFAHGSYLSIGARTAPPDEYSFTRWSVDRHSRSAYLGAARTWLYPLCPSRTRCTQRTAPR